VLGIRVGQQAALELSLLPLKAAKLVAALGPLMDPAYRKFGPKLGMIGLPALHNLETLQLVGRIGAVPEEAWAVFGSRVSEVRILSPRLILTSFSAEAEDGDRGVSAADIGSHRVVDPHEARDDRHVLHAAGHCR
jgi:hypothetical protein